jgi:hypothetical protein
MGFSLLPEFFAFLAVDVFVAMSLLTCLLDDHFPERLAYFFQVAAIGGYVHVLISKELLTVFGDYMRFWFCFLYLSVALGSVIALNVYLAVIKKRWTLAKAFAGTVVFPIFLTSSFFIFNYARQVTVAYLSPLVMLSSAIVLGVSISALLKPQVFRKYWRRR